MLKKPLRVKEQSELVRAAEALRLLLAQVPIVQRVEIETEALLSGHRIDLLAQVDLADERHLLICELKLRGQPRMVRMALLQLQSAMTQLEVKATPVFIAPYLSPEAQRVCRDNDTGFLDLEGNARLSFGGVFLERLVANKPPAERRDLKSLFKPKSAQVLRLLLAHPYRAWRVADLAQQSRVSLGHVSNVRTSLLDREWAEISEHGLVLSDPDSLLDSWREGYRPPAGSQLSFYTPLHGRGFDEAARQALGCDQQATALFASYSAARWLAPYGRIGTDYFYADKTGLGKLKAALHLDDAAKGGNVQIKLIEDMSLFQDFVEPAPGAYCTHPVQTYLDLASSGERGLESAEHLRRERIAWPTK